MTPDTINNLRPELVPSLYKLKRSGRCLFLNPDVPDWITLKSKYAWILEACDGTKSVTDICHLINDKFVNENAHQLVRQFMQVVSTSAIFKHGIQTETCELANNVVCEENQQVQSKLRYVYLTLTDACNLTCKYCYAHERQFANNSTFSDWCSYVSQCLTLSSKLTFTLTGGEPLLAPFTLQLANFIQGHGAETFLITNGTLITDYEQATRLSDAFNKIRISIDSLDEGRNGYLRGPGVLKKALDAYEMLTKVGGNVEILSTVTGTNIDDVASLASHFGSCVQFQPLYRKGDGRSAEELHITGKQYFKTLNTACVSTNLPGPWQSIHAFRRAPYRRCALAVEELSIGPDGTAYPCHMLHYQQFSLGNLKKDLLPEMYHSSPILKRLRSQDVTTYSGCRVCPVRYFCGGACRARIDPKGENISRRDPFCSYEKTAILDALLWSFG